MTRTADILTQKDLFEPGIIAHQIKRRAIPEPIETYHGKAAMVRLYSWGRPGDERLSLNVCPNGTAGLTFAGTSIADLRRKAAEHYPRDRQRDVLRDVERCLWRSRRQGVLALTITPEP